MSISACAIYSSNKNLDKTLKDNNRPAIHILDEYDFIKASESDIDSVEDKTKYTLTIDSDNLRECYKDKSNKKIKIFYYSIKLKNIGKGIAKNLSLYYIDNNKLIEIDFVNNYNIINTNNIINHSILMESNKEIPVNMQFKTIETNKQYDRFIGLLFYQDVNEELYASLVELELLGNNENNYIREISYYNLDLYGYKKEIYNIINRIKNNEKDINVNISNKEINKKTKDLIMSIQSTIENKKKQIKELNSLFEKLKINLN